MEKITRYLTEYKTPKSDVARMIGVVPVYLYAYLEPDRYPGRTLGDKHLLRIAAFEGVTVDAVRAEYDARRGAA